MKKELTKTDWAVTIVAAVVVFIGVVHLRNEWRNSHIDKRIEAARRPLLPVLQSDTVVVSIVLHTSCGSDTTYYRVKFVGNHE